jgi:hypothetical protein
MPLLNTPPPIPQKSTRRGLIHFAEIRVEKPLKWICVNGISDCDVNRIYVHTNGFIEHMGIEESDTNPTPSAGCASLPVTWPKY